MAKANSTTEHSGICLDCIEERLNVIIGAVLDMEESLGIDRQKDVSEWPKVFAETAESLYDITCAADELAKGLGIFPFGDEKEEGLRRGYLTGRIEGLAGTTRYNLTDDDRAVLGEVAGLLEGSDL